MNRIFITGFLALAFVACAHSSSLPEAEEVLKDIYAGQAGGVVSSLTSERAFAVHVYESIAAGKPAWLQVACALKPHADASVATSLRFSVAQALPTDPVTVLRIAGSCYTVGEICATDPYVEDPEASYTWHKSLESALAQPAPSDLAEVWRACAQANLK